MLSRPGACGRFAALEVEPYKPFPVDGSAVVGTVAAARADERRPKSLMTVGTGLPCGLYRRCSERVSYPILSLSALHVPFGWDSEMVSIRPHRT